MSFELVPHTDIDTARNQFEQFGHVGLTGLYDPALGEPAIADARAVVIPRSSHVRGRGEEVITLRTPYETRQHALHLILRGIQRGATLLGSDIAPAISGEKPFIQFLEMGSDARGPLHQDHDTLVDVVAITNLRGSSQLWFEGNDDADGDTYTIEPGHVVIHDLHRRLWHQGFTGPDEQRIGLAVAKRS